MGNENNGSKTCRSNVASKHAFQTLLLRHASKTMPLKLSHQTMPLKEAAVSQNNPHQTQAMARLPKCAALFPLSVRDGAWPVLCRIGPLNLSLGAAGPQRKVRPSGPTQPNALRPPPQPQSEDLSQQKGKRPEGLKMKDLQPGHRKIIFTLAGGQCSHTGKTTRGRRHRGTNLQPRRV